ncbi:MAG: lipoyl(octanoyl) transferase LipB [Verrucomicrobia bacterium]|nr:lipoyl(octanoyl) transferase LipB [Verrucomicrobiota bacterium]
MNASVLTVIDVGRQPYEPVLALQEALVEQRKAGQVGDTLVLVEHEPVYTLGRGATESNVLASADWLAEHQITVVRTGRGGEVTYHGPGQLVGYPIFHLGERKRGAVWYVGQLETVLIETLSTFGITAKTDPINRGVWVGRDKIAAIGVRITRHVTMHGFALNVEPDLAHYAGIVPCGIQNRGVTTMALQRNQVAMADVKQRVLTAIMQTFDFDQVVTASNPLEDVTHATT